jgi:hypothetical protein
MGRTKKPPVVWQDFHDEGAFRSTFTSRANPQLFGLAVDKEDTGAEVSREISSKGKAKMDREGGEDKGVKAEDGASMKEEQKVTTDIKREDGMLPESKVSFSFIARDMSWSLSRRVTLMLTLLQPGEDRKDSDDNKANYKAHTLLYDRSCNAGGLSLVSPPASLLSLGT